MSAFLRLCAILAIALFLSACGKTPRLAPLAPSDTVLAFGDSLTFGTGAQPSESYPAQLGALIGRKVVNAGVPGEISEEGLKRLPEVIDEIQPRLLVLCHGGNDFLRKLDEAKAADNVRAMIRLARQKNIDVVLLATPRPGLSVQAAPFYAEIAKETGIPFQGAVMADVLGDRALKSDLVHPNAQGYAMVAESVAQLLRKAGAL